MSGEAKRYYRKPYGTAAAWTAANPILKQGEEGFETDTRKNKTGDGITPWNDLAYDAGGAGATAWGDITGTVTDQTDLVTYINTAVTGLWDDRGNYDASTNLFPSSGGSGTAGAILKGDIWLITVGGTLGGTTVVAGDTVRALVDSPGTTPSNWSIAQNTNAGLGAAGGDLAGSYPNPTVAQSSTAFALTGIIAPTALSNGSTTNDWNPTGLSGANVIRASSGGQATLNGLAGGASGRVILFQNVGTNIIILAHEAAGSTAANRFSISAGSTSLGTSATVWPKQSVLLWYDVTDSRWRVLTAPIMPIPLPISMGGTAASLSDPGSDKLIYFNTTTDKFDFVTIGNYLDLYAGTLSGVPPVPVIIPVDSSGYSAPEYWGERVLICDTSGGDATVLLPSASLSTAVFHIKKITADANTVIITTGGETIDGGASAVLAVQYESVSIISDGTNFIII